MDNLNLIKVKKKVYESLKNTGYNNFLLAIGNANGNFAVAWADMSTGTFHTQDINEESI